MNEFEKKQCELIALYTPVSFVRVAQIFLEYDKSFDATLAHITRELMFGRNP